MDYIYIERDYCNNYVVCKAADFHCRHRLNKIRKVR